VQGEALDHRPEGQGQLVSAMSPEASGLLAGPDDTREDVVGNLAFAADDVFRFVGHRLGHTRLRDERAGPGEVFAAVEAVVAQRCVPCHNAQLQQKNVALHTPELLRQHAQSVYQQAAVLKLMPLNNATQMTDDERALVRRWYDSGAPGR